MATYEGAQWLRPQVQSVLDQRDVDVSIVISDDGSTDGTLELTQNLAAADDRITVLPPRTGERGVGANFLHALENLDLQPGQYAAFADQDDLWQPRKLIEQIQLLQETGAAATSSNVIAFTTGEKAGRKEVIRKDHSQVKWDHIFEAPSAGSTFVLTFEAWKLVVDYLDRWGVAGIALHDWFVYALVRAADMQWIIDPRPHVAYRQHGGNALGAHKGLKAIRTRLKKLWGGHYREQFQLTAEAVRRVGEETGRDDLWKEDLRGLMDALEDKSLRGRWQIMKRAGQIRRSRKEGLALAALCLAGVW